MMAKGGYRGLKGNGAGWGGPAKGPGKSGPGSGAGRPKASEAALKAATKAERLEKLTAHLEHLALNAATEQVQFSATVAALNRIEGTPISRSMKVETDDLSKLTAEELAARREHLARLEEEAGRRASPAADPGQLGRVVN